MKKCNRKSKTKLWWWISIACEIKFQKIGKWKSRHKNQRKKTLINFQDNEIKASMKKSNWAKTKRTQKRLLAVSIVLQLLLRREIISKSAHNLSFRRFSFNEFFFVLIPSRLRGRYLWFPRLLCYILILTKKKHERKEKREQLYDGKEEKKRQNRRGKKINSQTINGHTKSKETGNKPTDDEKKTHSAHNATIHLLLLIWTSKLPSTSSYTYIWK